jgi:hypothetical protein
MRTITHEENMVFKSLSLLTATINRELTVSREDRVIVTVDRVMRTDLRYTDIHWTKICNDAPVDLSGFAAASEDKIISARLAHDDSVSDDKVICSLDRIIAILR